MRKGAGERITCESGGGASLRKIEVKFLSPRGVTSSASRVLDDRGSKSELRLRNNCSRDLSRHSSPKRVKIER